MHIAQKFEYLLDTYRRPDGHRWTGQQLDEATGRLEHLFKAVRNPKTGEPYTNAEVARMTLGDLSEEDVEGMRTGAIGDPTVGQVAALASVFGVEPSYLLNRKGTPLLDEEIVGA